MRLRRVQAYTTPVIPSPTYYNAFLPQLTARSAIEDMVTQEAQQNGNLSTAERSHENDINLSRQICPKPQLNSICKATDPVQDETSAISTPVLPAQQQHSALLTVDCSISPPTAPSTDQISTQGMQFFAKASPGTLGGVLVSLCLLR